MAFVPGTAVAGGAVLPLDDATYLYNNPWGVTTDVTGTQRITTYAPSRWSTSWDWWFAQDWHGVISYSAAVRGAHQTLWRTGFTKGDLPIRARDASRITLDTAFAVTPGGRPVNRYNVAWDIWGYPNPNATGPRSEIMLWLNFTRDIGTKAIILGTPSIGGVAWKYQNQNNVPTLMAVTNWNSIALNLGDIILYLIQMGAIDPALYITGIEFGVEVYKGAGVLDVSRYEVTIAPDWQARCVAAEAAALQATNDAQTTRALLDAEMVRNSGLLNRLDQIAVLADTETGP